MQNIKLKTENDCIKSVNYELCEIHKQDKDTVVYLYSTGVPRKIVIKNESNIAEALRDSLNCVPSFVSTSKDLQKMRATFRKKLWPTLDGEEIVPSFNNEPIERLELSSRAYNALEKNDILTLGKIPSKLEEIKNLKSVGSKVAKEIFNNRKTFLKKITGGAKRKRKKSRKLIIESEIPKNLQKILLANSLAFLDEIPKDIDSLLSLNKLGPSKAKQILDIVS